MGAVQIVVLSFLTSLFAHLHAQIVRSVVAQQEEARKGIVENKMTSHVFTSTEDETHATVDGAALHRGLGLAGEPLKVRSTSSGNKVVTCEKNVVSFMTVFQEFHVFPG